MFRNKIKREIKYIKDRNNSLFHHFSKMKAHHQIIFSLIIAFAVVSFWRGAWGILDQYLLPNNFILSSWISLIIGISILIVTHYVTRELT